MGLHGQAEMTGSDMQHHEVFSRFRRYGGEIPHGYEVDFLGT
jgi:hypothetical protein